MRVLSSLAAAIAAVAAVPASAGDLSGKYVARGSCPEQNGGYRIALTIESTGLFHTLVWDDGEAVAFGTAMEVEDRLVIAFQYPDGSGGLMEMTRFEGRWYGRWGMRGAEVLCHEEWERVEDSS